MSTTRNRTKDESEKGSGTKRSSKSIDPKSANLPSETNYQPPSVYYQCHGCRNILSNSNCVKREIKFDELLLLFSLKSENFNVNENEMFVGEESEYDQYCVFNVVSCAFCGEGLGKYYLSTTEKMNDAKNYYTIPESNFLIFDTRTAKVSTPSVKKVRKEKALTTSKKVIVNKVVKEGESKDVKENKENLRDFNKDDIENSENKDNRRTSKRNKENKDLKENKETIQYLTTPKQEPNAKKIQESLRKLTPERNVEEERKVDDAKRQSLGARSEEGESDPYSKKIEQHFMEMRMILTNFAGLLDQYDRRLINSEKTITEINKTLMSVYGALNIAELIDLSE